MVITKVLTGDHIQLNKCKAETLLGSLYSASRALVLGFLFNLNMCVSPVI